MGALRQDPKRAWEDQAPKRGPDQGALFLGDQVGIFDGAADHQLCRYCGKACESFGVCVHGATCETCQPCESCAEDGPEPVGCDQCEVLSVNGTATHEQGCPNSWRDPVTGKGYPVECFECGCMWAPDAGPSTRRGICLDCVDEGRG